MKADIGICAELGCDGVVFGILKSDGSVDAERCGELLSLAGSYGLAATFHRAFDVCTDPLAELETIIDLGFERILTSGAADTAIEGSPMIASLVKQAGNRIIIMPGSGVSEDNINALAAYTGATEFHSSAKTSTPSAMQFINAKITTFSALAPITKSDSGRVRRMLKNAGQKINKQPIYLMKRRVFLKNSGLLTAGLFINQVPGYAFYAPGFPVVRVPAGKRHFKSMAVEKAIETFQAKVRDKELAWLFGNCFPNTLDTTVFFSESKGRPDTYVITGDIDAMWLRDSAAQVSPYLAFAKEDKSIQRLIAGVINRQSAYVLKDPYANAFYKDVTQVSEWQADLTDMKPGVHERKWEIDSLCYPIRLAYKYWKATGDVTPFDVQWKNAVITTLKIFREQQRKEGRGSYHFMRKTEKPTDSLPMNGFGFPVKPVGLICSMFRPSDDASIYTFLIPSNFFAVVSLKQAAEMIRFIHKDAELSRELLSLAAEVETALQKYATAEHPDFGRIYVYEADGFGNRTFMDDANVPSLLALPYLGAVETDDPVYANTRKFVLSASNPFFYKGAIAEGIGGPHITADNMIWPMSIVVRGLTSTDDTEITQCISTLKKTHAGTGFMHESFHKDDAANFTRAWFAWANTLFGEFLWKVYQEKPYLLV